MKKHTYVLGTGVSHDGSACLLKDGKICVAIEKERVTRVKHDGMNDTDAINYCLQAEGITIHDVDLIVQNANFNSFRYGSDYFFGERPFTESMGIPIVTISHHLAHAYSTIGTCPFDEFNVLVMDGCGNAFHDCMDLQGAEIPDLNLIKMLPHLWNEKDSYYRFKDNTYTSLVKDFSEWGHTIEGYAMHTFTTKHSIGGLYLAVSQYCFGNFADPGKLMGLAPYGKPGVFKEDVFELKDGRVFINYDWMGKYTRLARSYDEFKNNFQYYADIAYGIQQQVEKAILYVVNARLEAYPAENLCYSGGTALNAVANAKILSGSRIKNIYVEPAAGDNGLGLGCAFYGWLEVLKKERVKHDGSTCFGITYPASKIKEELDTFSFGDDPVKMKNSVDLFFRHLNKEQNTQPGKKATIQFNIENLGVFQVVIDGGLKSASDIFEKPTCVINANGTDFFQLLQYPRSFMEMVEANKIRVSNIRDLELLLDNIDIDEVAANLNDHLFLNFHKNGSAVKYEMSDDYIKETARLLASGKVIGWFQDGCEFGPRALGRRSILADPRNPDVRNFINSEVKFREDFRPFAPSVLKEDVSEYFQTDRESPYMLLIYPVRDAYRDKIKSVVHEDGTCRIQTVTPDWSPKFYALLQEFKKLTGVGVLLNTSFNCKGMPIVETPRDALNFFFSCKLDYLVIDKFIVGKE